VAAGLVLAVPLPCGCRGRDRTAAASSGAAAEGGARNAETGSLWISVTQPGLSLFVDGHEAGRLPPVVHELPAGVHSVRVGGSDRYVPFEETITIEPHRLLDLGAITLTVVRGKVTIEASPCATVFLVKDQERTELPSLPISIDLEVGPAWSIEARQPHHRPWIRRVSFDDGQAEKRYAIELEPIEPRSTGAAGMDHCDAGAVRCTPTSALESGRPDFLRACAEGRGGVRPGIYTVTVAHQGDDARANVTSAEGGVPDGCFVNAVAMWAMYRLHDRCQHELTLRVPLDVRDPPQILRHSVRPVILGGPEADPGIRWPPSP
jgi:hypothetical protein